MSTTRRTFIQSTLAGTASLPLMSVCKESSAKAVENCEGSLSSQPKWAKGLDGQRQADLGDGTFLNPIVAGDRADPTILRDGKDYYMTFSSFKSKPGIVIWHSTDLVNWTPICAALKNVVGTVWALDLVKHNDRYFVYIPVLTDSGFTTQVIWADNIKGPWSDPIDLKINDCIDPGHIVGEDGKRYLFVNGIRMIRLSDDGLSADGELKDAYDPWRYPDDWIVENFAPEGPKLFQRGEYFYLVTAVGGTAGPVTGHMVIAARSKSVHGPWEHCPYNPLVRSLSSQEPWWSRGHASLVQGPTDDWWCVYHGYENGYRNLGRQTLLAPVEWTEDGWFQIKGGDLGAPLQKPKGGVTGTSGQRLSDDFSTDRLGTLWSIDDQDMQHLDRLKYLKNSLMFRSTGNSPADSPPLTCIPVDRAYEAQVAIELQGDSEAGLLLYYKPTAFVGFGFNGKLIKTFSTAEELPWRRHPVKARKLYLRLQNYHHIVTAHYSLDGENWVQNEPRWEVSGLNHNVFGEFLSLRLGIYSVGGGNIVIRDFRYKALEGEPI